ncbi:metal ABC transporter permease [Pallidibacillus pasinlerensis]|uniref:Metal ABC transporter permease n=1 Tax=Pallidibacillus pasinlerensis TaxID=2703818 RepID=A0ABX0A7E6_9BACI|nr:metal ABC transporter permease [Pallidibacillus pasinlerensis]NCU18737.1 metal ABC transporter permease [Pallidibacillus pasinlerensis]
MFQTFLQYEFLQNSFLTGMIIGIIAPLLGVFIVVRKMSLIADALSHISLSGIAATMLAATYSPFFAGISPLYGGMLFSVIGALFIEKLRSVYKHFEELSIPIIMSIGIGLGVIFISLADGFNNDLFGYLFGSVSAVSRTDLYSIFIIGLLVVLIIIFLYKELFLLAFDEEYGKAQGIRGNIVHLIFIILVALVIAISIRIVGVLLVSSLMTLPVAASMRMAKSFKQTIIFSIIFGEVSVVGGLISAFYLDLAPGGTIVCISAVILIITILYSKKLKYNAR